MKRPIVLMFEDPCAYEVEFCNNDGVMLPLVTLNEDDLEKAP